MPQGDSAKARIRNYFLERIGEVVTKEDLIAVTPISEWARRVRELRDEEGWPILSYKNTLTPDEMELYSLDRQLKPGEYILAGTEKMDVTARLISKDIRHAVLQRYGATCQFCGRSHHDPDPYNPNRNVIMHIDHIVSLKDGGTNDLENLWPVCSVCNEGKKERSFIRKDVLQLLQEINMQPPDVQREVYMHLRERFG